MKRLPFFVAILLGGLLLMGANGCSSDPNVEGAKLDLRNKDYDRALENLETALEKNPQNAEALELKGQVLQQMAFETPDPEEHTQLLQDMMEAYSQAAEINPELAGDINNRLQLAFASEFDRGIQAFNRGQEDDTVFSEAAAYFGNAATLGQEASMADSTLAGAHANQAYALINAGEAEAAIAPMQQAVNMGDNAADTYVILADLYRTTEQYEKVIEVLENARQLYPDNEDIAAQLLNAYVSSGQMDRAMDEYQAQVEADPDNKLYRYNYGSLLLESERYDDAIEQLKKAVEIDPEYGSAQYNLGAAYVNKAVDVNERINAMDDSLRANREELSADEEEELQAEMEELAEQRRQLFADAIPQLERARAQAEAEGDDATGICQALFQAYVQTQQPDEKVQEAADCAGIDLN